MQFCFDSDELEVRERRNARKMRGRYLPGFDTIVLASEREKTFLENLYDVDSGAFNGSNCHRHVGDNALN